jgi:hypothetical protein
VELVFAGVSEVYAAGNVVASSLYRVTVSTAENLPEDCLYEPITQESVYAQVDGSMLLTDRSNPGFLSRFPAPSTEWPVQFLSRPRRNAHTIADFVSPNAPSNRLEILRGFA